MAKDNEQQTMEEYLLSQLDTPVVLKDGTMMTKPDGSPMTKQEAIATNILNLAMKKQEDVNIEVVSIDDLIQDDHNFNKGNEQGAQLLERSFRECGAGRSVLIDKDNRLVEGI